MTAVSDRYLSLLKVALTRYDLDGGWRYEPYRTHRGGIRGRARNALIDRLARRGMVLMNRERIDLGRVAEGSERPTNAETMIGLKRLDNIQFCVEDVIARGVPGDLIETGVWRGGACIFMRGVLAAHGVTDRTVWVADSFEGLPKPDAAAYPADAGDEHWKKSELLAVSVEDVQANFRRYGLLDGQVRFLRGWFKDTLPGQVERLAVLRLDGDMYESTIQALDALFPKVSPGGYVIVDDYGAVEGCRQAVDDFRAAHGIGDPLVEIDWGGVYWQSVH